jgi:hypothetical protein
MDLDGVGDDRLFSAPRGAFVPQLVPPTPLLAALVAGVDEVVERLVFGSGTMGSPFDEQMKRRLPAVNAHQHGIDLHGVPPAPPDFE